MSNIAGLYLSNSGSMDFPKLLDRVQIYLSENYKDLMAVGGSKNPEQTKAYIRQYLTAQRLSVDGMAPDQTVDRLYREMAEFSILTPYLNHEVKDAKGNEIVEGIEICSWDNIWISYSDGHEEQMQEHFFSPKHARDVIIRLLHQSGIPIDNTKPLAIGHLGKNIRVTVDGGGGTLDEDVGISASIRFINPNHLTKKDLISNGTLTEEMVDFLIAAYRYGLSMVLAGKTDAGKTTLMSIIMEEAVPPEKKLITIEYQDREFNLVTPNNKVVHFRTRESDKPEQVISAQKLIEFAMTMNPSYLCLAEIKGSEAYETIEAAETGHPVIATVHGASAADIPNRLVPLAALRSKNFSEQTLYRLAAQAFPILFYAQKKEDGKRRVTQISECYYEDGQIHVVPLWRFKTDCSEKVNRGTDVHGHFEKVNNISETLQQKLRENDIPEDLLQSFLKEG